MKFLVAILLLIAGFVLLIKGADWFVDGAAGIAARFGIPQLVIGLTIVAMGTSAPEAAVSITAATSGNAGITIGNVIGSNILNVLIILGLTAVIIAVPVQKSTVKWEMPFMHVITIVLVLLGLTGGEIVFWEGIVLWVLFLVYLGYLFKMAKKGNSDEEPEEILPRWKQLLMVAIGVICIVYGSDLTVDNATIIAEALGMDGRLIGLTIVALGTSLPEMVTSVTAARKGKADIAIGNIVGSNIFNILFVVGTTALITPVAFNANFLIDGVVALAAGLLLWFAVVNDRKLSRSEGVIMLVAYGVYFVHLLNG